METFKKIFYNLEPFRDVLEETVDSSISQANKVASTIKKNGCDALSDALNDGTILTQAQQLTAEIMDRIQSNQNDDCFDSTFKDYKPKIIKNINEKKNIFLIKEEHFYQKYLTWI